MGRKLGYARNQHEADSSRALFGVLFNLEDGDMFLRDVC
jgi:hypothetical protein